MMVVRHCLLFGLLIICVYTDLAHRKIYNWCTLPAIVVGLLLSYAMGGLWDGGWLGVNLGSAALALALVGVIFGWPYARGGIAAGDVKLILAVGAIGGLHNAFTPYAVFYSALIGALMAVLALIWRGKLKEGLKGAVHFTFSTQRLRASGEDELEEKKPSVSGVTVPYGLAIALGSVIAWYQVELLRAL